MMKAEASEQYPIIEKLEYNFLINEDIYSFNTLMSLLNDKNFVKFSKNDFYMKDYVIKNLKKFFYDLSNIDQIIDNLETLISNDLNRYEYLISIKAQYRAFRDKKLIDKLEYELIETFDVSYMMDSLTYPSSKKDSKILQIGENFKENIYSDKELVSNLTRDMGKYCKLKIKANILTLDQSTHRQLKFDSTNSIYAEDITLKQMKKIYDKSVSYLYKSVVDVYAEYYFRGLIREVLERYQ